MSLFNHCKHVGMRTNFTVMLGAQVIVPPDLAQFAQIIVTLCLPHDNINMCVTEVHARKATHAE